MWYGLLYAVVVALLIFAAGWVGFLWLRSPPPVRRSTIFKAPITHPRSGDAHRAREDLLPNGAHQTTIRTGRRPFTPTQRTPLLGTEFQVPTASPTDLDQTSPLETFIEAPRWNNEAGETPTEPTPTSPISSPSRPIYMETPYIEASPPSEYNRIIKKTPTTTYSKPKRPARLEEERNYQSEQLSPPSTSKDNVLVKLRKKEPVRHHLTTPDRPDHAKEATSPSPEKEPEVKFKVSFSNPMMMKISYKEDSMVLSLTWPKSDPNWMPKWERRLESLSSDSARSEYFYQNRLYVDRPDWGYRIMIWVPESPGWTPDWIVRTGDKSQGPASPINIPSPSQTLKIAIDQAPSAKNGPSPAEKPSTPKFAAFATPAPGATTGVLPSTPPSTTTTTKFGIPVPRNDAISAAPAPASIEQPTAPVLPIATPKLPAFSAPKVSAFMPKVPTTLPPVTVEEKPLPSPVPSSAATAPTVVSPTPVVMPPKLSAPVPSTPTPVITSNPPTPSGPRASTAAASSSIGSPSMLPSKLDSPIISYIPEPLKSLPPEARADRIVPGEGVSAGAWKDYMHVMDETEKYKKLMTPQHPEATKIDELVKDISNKIGATAASFREKLGDEGLDGALLQLQNHNLMGVYYFGLERFAYKVFAEAALNKFLESESNAIKYGERIVFMLQRHPLLEIFIKFWIYSRCPFATSIWPQRRPGQDEKDYKTKELGFKPAELDNLSDYLSRTRRTMYLYASIMNTAPPTVPNPMGIGTAWTFLVRTLALPRTEISIWYLEPVVNICSRRLMFAYGSQWGKLSQRILKYLEEPTGANSKKFFESASYMAAIRMAIEMPTVHTPIQHYPDHENLMELKSRNSYKMEFEDGRFITPEQLDTVYMMSDAYHDFLDSHVGDIVDDILAEVKNWDDILDKVDEGILAVQEGGPPRQQQRRNGRGGGRGGRNFGGGRGGGRGRW